MKQVEVEGGELAIKNSFGDIAIIPKKYRAEVERMIKDKCWSCIDTFVDTLPLASDYAQDGSVYSPNTKVQVYTGDPNYDVKSLAPRVGARKNDDGTESTHLMTYTSVGNKYYAYPTLFQNKDGNWLELSDKNNWEAFEEAKKRKEIFEFDDEKSAKDFAEGSWKKNYKEYYTSSPEYRKLYNSGKLTFYDKDTDTYIATPLKEIIVTTTQ